MRPTPFLQWILVSTVAAVLFAACSDDSGSSDDVTNPDSTDMDTTMDVSDTSDTGDTGDTTDGTDTADAADGTDTADMTPVCGNNAVEAGEQCDDGNTMSGDGCDDMCQNEGAAMCGDGIPQTGEGCDLGTANDDTLSGACPTVCRTNCQCPSCGDGVADFAANEECDDGNTMDGDGCDSSCLIETGANCGDGTLDIVDGEECDDGNTMAGDGCSANCQYEPVGQTCGDSNIDMPLEKCDDGNTANGDGCNPTCNLTTAVTTLNNNLDGTAVAVDDTYLWIGDCNTCVISRLDVMDCVNNSNCTPTVVAGTGTCGTPTDGNGTSAVLACPGTLTTDGSTVWFSNQHTIRELDVATGDVTTVAGDAALCAAVDGTGTTALFHDIRGLTYHNGLLYLLDGCENTLREYDPSTATVTTIAGTRAPDPGTPQMGPNQYQCQPSFTCSSGTPADGIGPAAVFGSPRYMASDNAGNLFITDTNGQAMRTYNIATSRVGTLVGGGGYQDGVGAAVRLGRPRGVASDGTSVYFTEQNAHTVRQVVIQTTDTSTLAGVRGCNGGQNGTGGNGTQDWAGMCNQAGMGLPRFDTPFGAIAFHYPSRSILLIENGRLRRIE